MIHISNVDEALKFTIASCFADDTRLMMRVKTEDDHGKFEMNLLSIYKWAHENKMSFNEEKFVYIRCDHPKVLVVQGDYKCPGGSSIKIETHTKDL